MPHLHPPVHPRIVPCLLAGLLGLAAAQPSTTVAGPTAETCLRLATIQEPELDLEALRAGLEALVEEARASIQDAETPGEIVAGLNRTLLADREVTYLSNKYWRDSTLSASVLRRRGNCLSTTTLYVVVGEALELPIHAVLIPRHAFARFDDGETRINIETTAGGQALSDEQYEIQSPYLQVDQRVLGYGRSLEPSEFQAVLHRYAARHCFQTRRPQEALELVEQAQELWRDQPELELERLSILYEGLGEHERSLRGYGALLETCPSPEIRTRALLGITGDLQGRSRHEEALGLLRQAYRISPRVTMPAVLSAMSSSYRTLRRFEEALITAELSALQVGEADDYTNLAILYKNAERLDDAIRCLRRSLELNPESWNTRLILAGYLIRNGQDEEGWKMFETVEAPRVDPTFYETNLAWFYGSVGRKKEFLEHLDQALRLSETPSILNYIKTEVDFDRYREDPDFQALVERHRKRLLGE